MCGDANGAVRAVQVLACRVESGGGPAVATYVSGPRCRPVRTHIVLVRSGTGRREVAARLGPPAPD